MFTVDVNNNTTISTTSCGLLGFDIEWRAFNISEKSKKGNRAIQGKNLLHQEHSSFLDRPCSVRMQTGSHKRCSPLKNMQGKHGGTFKHLNIPIASQVGAESVHVPVASHVLTSAPISWKPASHEYRAVFS